MQSGRAVRVLVPAANGMILSESFHLREFMKVTCTHKKQVGGRNILGDRERARAAAGAAGAHQLRRTFWRGSRLDKDPSSVTARMVIMEHLE